MVYYGLLWFILLNLSTFYEPNYKSMGDVPYIQELSLIRGCYFVSWLENSVTSVPTLCKK